MSEIILFYLLLLIPIHIFVLFYFFFELEVIMLYALQCVVKIIIMITIILCCVNRHSWIYIIYIIYLRLKQFL